MALKAGNLQVFAQAANEASRLLLEASRTAQKEERNILNNQNLSQPAKDEIEAAAEAKLADLSELNTAVLVVKEIFKNVTPLVKFQNDPVEPNFGMYVAQSDNSFVFDPAAL